MLAPLTRPSYIGVCYIHIVSYSGRERPGNWKRKELLSDVTEDLELSAAILFEVQYWC